MVDDNNKTPDLSLNRPEEGYDVPDPSWADLLNENFTKVDDALSGDTTIPDLDADSINTNEVLNSAIGDGVDYIHPSWLVQSDFQLLIFPIWSGNNFSTSGSGSNSDNAYYFTLSTGSTSGSSSEIRFVNTSGFSDSLDLTTDRISFKTSFRFGGGLSDRTDYATIGRVFVGNHGVGFKLSGGTLYGVLSDGGTETTVQLITPTNSTDYTFRLEFDPSKPLAEFYINGTKEGELTSGFPSGTDYPGVAHYVENSAGNDKTHNISKLAPLGVIHP